jgi:hypothetical protein
VYFDAGGGSWYRSAAYASGFGSWQKYVTENGGTWGINISGNAATVSSITPNTALMVNRLTPTSFIDGLTTSNFRSTLFGTSSNGAAIAAARWNNVPAPLSGMTLYGTMIAWSGDSDTQGFLAINYETPGATVGGGYGNFISWSKRLAFSDGTGASGTWGINISGTAGSETLATVTGRGNTTASRIGVSTSAPINLATSGNVGTWIGGVQDATTGWSISTNGIGLKSDDNTYATIGLGASNGPIYFGRTTNAGVGTLTSWLEVYANGVANFLRARPQFNGNTILDAANFNSYSPTLTGGGASGTWSINVTGNAQYLANNYIGQADANTIWRAGSYTFFNGVNVPAGDFGLISVPTWSSTDPNSRYNLQLGSQIGGPLRYRSTNINGAGSWATMLSDANYTSYAVQTTGQSNWANYGVINNVVGLLAWKNYGNGHVIFDASQGTSPSGTSINQTNSAGPWQAGYPTLMGWNGANTYGVRVDSARVADSAGTAGSVDFNNLTNKTGGTGTYQTSGDFRAPIFYDSDDTGYYADPNSISRFYGLAIRGDNNSTGTDNQIFFWGAGNTTTSAIGFKANGGYFTNPTGFGDGYNTYLTMDSDGRGWVFRRGVGGTDFGAAYTSGWILNNGIWQANASMRAPIFYDSQDTSYYGDFNSQSRFNTLKIGNQGTFNSGNDYALQLSHNNRYLIALCYNNSSYYPWLVNDTWNGLEALIFHFNGIGDRFFFNRAGQMRADGLIVSGDSMRSPIFYDLDDTTYYLDPNADLSLRVYGEICNSNYQAGALQPGALNIGRIDTNYRWDGTTWASDIRLGILANCNEFWELAIHDSGDSVHSGLYYDGGTTFYIGRNIGWGTCSLIVGGDVTAYSDISVKENIRTIDNALDKTLALRGTYFNRTDTKDTRTKVGFIAQEVQQVVPELVSEMEDGLLGVSYGNAVALLVEAIKEQQKQIEHLKSQLDGITK